VVCVSVTDAGREARVPPRPVLMVVASLIALVLAWGTGPARAQDAAGEGFIFEPMAWGDRDLRLEPPAWDDRDFHFVPVAWAETAEPVAAPNPYRPTPPWKDLFATGDWPDLGRDTALLVTYQLLAIGFYFVLPESISKWTQSQKDNVNFDTWWENVQNPVWDKDEWYVNASHAYFGAAYYIRARERGFGEISSFLYSAFASTVLYEFGIEAFFERPSYQDLIITPIGGALLGAFVFEPVRRVIFAKPELRWYDHLMLVATDPIGTANYFVEKLLGIKSEIRVNARPPAFVADAPSRYRMGPARPVGDSHSRNSGVSVELRIRW
jgi:Domain of unknown function (DUF3943)